MTPADVPFLDRWSRRKRGEEVAPPSPTPEPEPPNPGPPTIASPDFVSPDVGLPGPGLPAVSPDACLPEPVVVADFDPASLPPIETLDAASDFTPFLKPGVPSGLRLAALRRAWTADPLIRDFMSPLDYAWDFNTPGGLPNGFSNVLAETGEALRKLISQAIGEIEPEEEEPPEVLALVEPTQTAEPESHPEPPPLPPWDPVRLSESPPPATLPAPEEAPLAPLRRHGGAMPV